MTSAERGRRNEEEKRKAMGKSFGKRIGAACSVLAIAAVLAVTARANTQPCGAGCGLQMRACVKAARTGMLSCKMGCRMNSDPNGVGACMRGCQRTFRSNQGICRGNL